MRTLIKLAILAVIVAFAVNYLNTNHIEVKAKVKSLLADLVTKYDEFAIKLEERNSSKNDSSYNSSNNSTFENHKTISDDKIVNNYNFVNEKEDFDVTGETSEYLEVRIPSAYDCLNVCFETQDQHASSAPDYHHTTIEKLVNYLVKPTNGDMEKARVIFTWIARNISYDDDGYNRGNYGDCTPESVFSSGKAVCQGYSELFKQMGNLAGLEIELIKGYAKGLSYSVGSTFYDTNHAWNAIKIDGKWRLFDVTWAAGYGTGVNGKLKSFKKFNDYWFDADPQAFIFSHLPEDSKWQLTDVTISKSNFEHFPYVQNNYFEMGFDGASCLRNVLNGSLIEFPTAYAMEDVNARVVSMPYQKKLESEKALMIRISSIKATDIAVINNGHWAHLKRKGKEFSGVFKPHSGKLSLEVKTDPNSHTYSTMLEYEVN